MKKSIIEYIGVIMISVAVILFFLSMFDIGFGCKPTPWGITCFSGFVGVMFFSVGMVLFLGAYVFRNKK